jgi:hypothetical protein
VFSKYALTSSIWLTEGNGFKAFDETLCCVAEAANAGKEVKEGEGSVHAAMVAIKGSSVKKLVVTGRTILPQ